MARTAIVAQSLAGSYPSLPYGAGTADLAWTATDDPTDRETPIVENKTVVLAWNTDVDPQTITINSQPLATYNREGDIVYSVGAGKIARFGPFKAAGWSNAGKLDIDVADPLVRLAVVTLP